MINSAEEVQPLRLELYAASMIKDGNCDLQSYIAYLTHRLKKLEAHGAMMSKLWQYSFVDCTRFINRCRYISRCRR